MAEEKPVVVYDGECPFCIRQIDRFKRWDKKGALQYVPRQQEGLEERFPVLAQGDFNAGMRFIGTDGNVAVGADAVYEICKALPAFGAFAWIYRIPGINQLARAAYAWVAANRMKLAGQCKDNVCR